MRHPITPATGRLLATGVCLLLAAPVLALVNPQLQPMHLVERYRATVGAVVTSADYEKGTVALRVTTLCAGTFEPKEITIAVPEVDVTEPSLFDDVEDGAAVVACIGRKRRRHERDVLVYAGKGWHRAEIADAARPAAWRWTEAVGDDMVGTFNGAAGQLVALMGDIAAGRAFFPPRPFVRFRKERIVGTFEGGVRGVALYDVNRDGRPDLYACCGKGDRLYLQTAPLVFQDATTRLGLDGVASPSCSVADVDADGRPDLLAGATVFRGTGDGFERTAALPPDAGRDLKGAAFVEVNGDGYPDVVVSREAGGLAVYLNPGPGAAAGAPFTDATEACGLDRPACGAGGTGFFAPGDWNRDGRTDLYYGVGKGLILVQDAAGRFAPVPHRIDFGYRVSGGGPGRTGGGGFAALWKPDRWDLVAAGDTHLTLVTNAGGTVRNVTGYGNETRVCQVAQLATLAADLNMDGRPDLLTVARMAGGRNSFHTNRGYGSFMLPELYADHEPFPGTWYGTGAGGAAAGDADGDGANDLLLGGADGRLRLAVSDTLAHRKPKPHPTWHERVLSRTRILTVRVTGRVGVVGALVTVTDAEGRVLGLRQVGGQVLTGCRGPDTVNVAVREPGPCRLTVRYADGHTRQWNVDLTKKPRVVLQAARSEGGAG
ncbi:MAG: VCBS repeat-containing protein [Phycisphaerae bacterium]